MQQHPVPQNISSYQFRLIGDMTLKQFLELLAGGVIAFIFYSTNLPGLIKWFFILIFVLLGFAFAFLPLEGRPLDQWLLAFIKAVYSPTIFNWKPSPASDKPAPSPTAPSATSPNQPPDPLDQYQPDRIDHITNLFQKNNLSAPPKPSSTTTLPSSKTLSQPPNQISSAANISPHQTTPSAKTITPPPPSPSTPSPGPQPTISSSPSSHSQPPAPNTVSATTNPDLPFPSLPENPNVLVGMVLDHNQKIVDAAVIEIRDNQGRPVRATKTNKLGQFFSITPLPAGSYTIYTEKPGLDFDPISLSLEDKIYPPIEIRAKTTSASLPITN